MPTITLKKAKIGLHPVYCRGVVICNFAFCGSFCSSTALLQFAFCSSLLQFAFLEFAFTVRFSSAVDFCRQQMSSWAEFSLDSIKYGLIKGGVQPRFGKRGWTPPNQDDRRGAASLVDQPIFSLLAVAYVIYTSFYSYNCDLKYKEGCTLLSRGTFWLVPTLQANRFSSLMHGI